MTPALRAAARAVLKAMLVAASVLGATAATRASSPAPQLGPRPHVDVPDGAGGRLDLTEVTFGQQGTRLRLRMRTAADWKAADLSGGRALCVVLYFGELPTPRVRICVAARAHEAALSYVRLTPQGGAHRSGTIDAVVDRPDRRTIAATFSPLAARLAPGRFSWVAESHWTDAAACPAPAGCADRVPDSGRIQATARLLAVPPCFGAAARDPLHPCRNPALRLAAIPTPAQATLLPNAFCRPTRRPDLVSPCVFGVAHEQAAATIALIGDSHAEHWRAAVEVVAQARRWRALSITRSSCPFAQATPIPPGGGAARALCTRWNRQVLRWLRLHREVRTVLVSANDLARYSGSPQDGFRATWKALPASVRRVIVLRDTPQIVRPQATCVERALAAHRPPGRRCAQSRASNLRPDPQVAAARALRSRRVRVVDLSRHLCDDELCFAVVGGALVHKDGSHLTATFAETLGPYLLRAIERLGRR